MKFKLDEHTFEAENCINGILINPVLPKDFDITDNSMRPDSHNKWWYLPFIETDSIDDSDRLYAERTDEYTEADRAKREESRKKWLEVFPTGIRYLVRCLDGGAWDRATSHGFYGDIDEALEKANSLK